MLMLMKIQRMRWQENREAALRKEHIEAEGENGGGKAKLDAHIYQ
jgi:hypothetical protein